MTAANIPTDHAPLPVNDHYVTTTLALECITNAKVVFRSIRLMLEDKVPMTEDALHLARMAEELCQSAAHEFKEQAEFLDEAGLGIVGVNRADR